jgi:hypothetical protein
VSGKRSRAERRRQAAGQRRAASRRGTPPASAPRRWLLPAIVALAAALLIGVVGAVLLNQSNAETPLPAATGQTIDDIACNTTEQLVYHIHAHLAVFVNGQAQTIPAGIGIPNAQIAQTAQGPVAVAGTCFYWLHTHTQDGIVHIESPTARTYTLGNFFDIWGQHLSSTQVGSAKGTVIAYLNGQRYGGDARSIPLTPHALIQLDVGQDVAPQPFAFATGL